MRIAYGVHGYGRGHSSRALAVLPQLTARHEVLVLAGDEAHAALAGEYDVVRIPVMRYVLNAAGRRSALRTLAGGLVASRDRAWGGPGLQVVRSAVEAFKPDVIVSDSEAWTHRAGKLLGLPRISFDHFGVLVWCDWPMGGPDRVVCRIESMLYLQMMSGGGDRAVVASFYAPPVRRSGVRVVGPVLREIVRGQAPSAGDYLLVYLANGQRHYTPRVEAALKALTVPTIVYGVGREGTDGAVEYRAPSNTRFVADLAGCRAVFATAGNQLISEAMHFRKPMLLLPEDSLEQRLNATAVERMGAGLATTRKTISPERVRELLDRANELAANIPPVTDGRAEAVAAIEQFAAELTA